SKQVADLREQLGVGGSHFLLLTALATFLELLERQHHQEVDDSRDDHEVDRGVDDTSEVEERASVLRQNPEAQSLSRVAPADRVDQRLDQTFGERRDNRGEGGTDDDCDGKLDDVAAHQEFLETLQHAPLPSTLDLNGYRSVTVTGRDNDIAARCAAGPGFAATSTSGPAPFAVLAAPSPESDAMTDNTGTSLARTCSPP